MNNVILIGRLGRDIELRQAGDHTVGNFSLAIQDGKDKTYWIDCVAWNNTANTIAKYSGKGLRLGITGKLIQESWEEKNGQTRNRIKVQVITTEIIDWKENSSTSQFKYNDDFNSDFESTEDKRIPF